MRQKEKITVLIKIMPDSKAIETNHSTTLKLAVSNGRKCKWVKITQYLKYMFKENSQIGGQQQGKSSVRG